MIQLLKNKNTWIVIIALVIIFIIYKSWAKIKGRIDQIFRTSAGDYDEPIRSREDFLNELASKLYSEINGFPGSLTGDTIDEALALNDSELDYLAKQYKNQSPNESLYQALNEEWSVWSGKKNELMGRLAVLNQMV